MEKLLVMTTNLTTMGYTYAAHRLNNPSYILGVLQRLAHPPGPIGNQRTPRHPMAFSGTKSHPNCLQHLRVRKGCEGSQPHKGVHGEDVVNRRPFCTR